MTFETVVTTGVFIFGACKMTSFPNQLKSSWGSFRFDCWTVLGQQNAMR